MRKKVTAFFSILLIFLILMSVSVSALSDTPYQGYTYDSFNTSNPAPVGFEPEATVNSGSLRLEIPLDTISEIALCKSFNCSSNTTP